MSDGFLGLLIPLITFIIALTSKLDALRNSQSVKSWQRVRDCDTELREDVVPELYKPNQSCERRASAFLRGVQLSLHTIVSAFSRKRLRRMGRGWMTSALIAISLFGMLMWILTGGIYEQEMVLAAILVLAVFAVGSLLLAQVTDRIIDILEDILEIPGKRELPTMPELD